eukprot:m.43186 g.43186  ORF g.43186 m.43186 type:complete len:767 (+) comp7096_c0_seq2:66-2366(+)
MVGSVNQSVCCVLLVLLVFGVVQQPTTAQLHITLSGNNFSIQVNGNTWFVSEYTGFFVENSWLTAGENLTLSSNKTFKGTNSYGSFQEYEFEWNHDSFSVNTAVQVYSSGDRIMFRQDWVTGANNTAAGDMDSVLSSFPSFDLTYKPSVPLGCIGWYGHFIDHGALGPQIGEYPSSCVVGGNDGGPMAIFDRDTNDVVMFAPATNFMMASMETNSSYIRAGVMGTGTSIPPGYSVSFSLTYGNNGINNHVTQWGNQLLASFNKSTTRGETDLPIHNLGYNTDHGSYYYYNPKNDNYTITLVELKESAVKLGIPYKFILLDSWWYYKGVGNGVKEWLAMPSVFPPGDVNGLMDVVNQTGWPVVGHNRYWAQDTVYAKENGGKFEFTSNKFNMVAPLTQEFWDFLMSSSKAWGLYTYEQDWLYNEFEGVPYLHENVTMAREWLLQMGRAADANGLSIQYCMANPRHALQSAEIQAVTQIRASDDYLASGPTQWYIGTSSMLAHALALAPFKDNFWSTQFQPGSSEGSVMNEPSPWRQCIVSTLSAGPVTPGDGIEYQNKDIIMRSCRKDGVLLQPDRPAVTIDTSAKAEAFNDSFLGPMGKVWITYSTASGMRFDHLFVSISETPCPFSQRNITLGLNTPRSDDLVVYSVDTETMSTSSLVVQPLSDANPLLIPRNANAQEVLLYHTSPVLSNGFAVLGDISKIVPTSPKRIETISVTQTSTQVVVNGAPDEVITIYFFNTKTSQSSSDTCTVASSSESCTVSTPSNV